MPPIRSLFFVLCALYAATLGAANPIQIENAKPGTGDWRLFSEAVNGEIEGYGSATSVNQGESISFYVNTLASTYELDIYRLGWYGGEGGRRVADTVVRTGVQQVIPTPDPVTGLTECNWVDPYTITIPNDWVSGAYLVKLTVLPSTPSEKNKYILFVVREDSRPANHNFQLTVTTAQAYNDWGGKSLYGTSPARKVSFNRPYTDGSGTGIFMWRWEYNAIRFLEREGYDLTYTTNIDTHRRGHLLLNAKSFLSIGHDEYWSWEMRTNVENALANGVNLGFFSANTCYWQIRFEPSTISGALDRTMVGYKSAAMSSDPYALDGNPSNDNRITTLWRDPPVNRPEAALMGVQYIYYPVREDIVIDDVTSQPWVFAETGLTTGSSLTGLLGYEVDAMNQFTPPGTVRLGHSPFQTESGTTMYSDMTIYDAGPAWVFATGSIQWAWGLDDWNGRNHTYAPVSHGAQQITRNILREFAGARAHVDCQVTITPEWVMVGSSAGSGSISLTTASHCGWSISSNATWLTASPTSGTGNATITYQYASNAGSPTRYGALTIADKTFDVEQSSGCSYSYSPASASIGAAGGTVSFNITTTNVCAWTAETQASWLTITSPQSGFGSGNATVTVSVAPNEGPSRDAGVYLNGVYHNVHQSGGCTYSAQPTSIVLPASGGEGEVTVATNSACFWSASTASSWIVITSGTSGQGEGVTRYTVQANTTGAERLGTLVVAGINVTVRQSATECLYQFSPLWKSHTSASGTGTINVTSACEFEAVVESGAAFIQISSVTPTAVNYVIGENVSSTARSGTIRIAGRAINITQNAAGMPMFSLTATATSTSAASLTWSGVSGAVSYEIYRSSNGGSLGLVTATSSLSHNDTGLASNRTYLYRVRALGASGVLSYSNLDPATTVMFTDPTIVAGVTRIKATHILQLRTAVNAMRTAAVLPSQTFTDNALSGVRIKAVHMSQLRDALAAARAAIGLPPVSYSDPALSVVRASHVNDLRSGVQ